MSIPKQGLSGLCNLGNTCYLNSSIQVLLNVHEMNLYLKDVKNVNKTQDSIILKEYLNLYNVLMSGNVIVSPNRFIKNIHEISKIKQNEFCGFSQNDATEFLHFIIDCIHESLKNIDKRFSKETGLPVHIADDPLSCVAVGTGKALEQEETFNTMLSEY